MSWCSQAQYKQCRMNDGTQTSVSRPLLHFLHSFYRPILEGSNNQRNSTHGCRSNIFPDNARLADTIHKAARSKHKRGNMEGKEPADLTATTNTETGASERHSQATGAASTTECSIKEGRVCPRQHLLPRGLGEQQQERVVHITLPV
jgi:hypothetical protein